MRCEVGSRQEGTVEAFINPHIAHGQTSLERTNYEVRLQDGDDDDDERPDQAD